MKNSVVNKRNQVNMKVKVMVEGVVGDVFLERFTNDATKYKEKNMR